MGMFDEIKCEYPLPDKEVQDHMFQTKSFDSIMDKYTITKEGKLILHKVMLETVPENERPYYNKPEWEMGLGKYMGSIRSVYLGDEEVPFHGIVYFYTSIKTDDKRTIYDYQAKFTDGKLEEIKRVEDKQ